jgi:hypothetical protein
MKRVDMANPGKRAGFDSILQIPQFIFLGTAPLNVYL